MAQASSAETGAVRSERMAFALKLAALGGFAATGAVIVFFALVVYFTLPGQYSGLDWIQATITWISVGLIALLAIGVNITYARVLYAMSRFPYGFPISGEFPKP